MEKAKLGASDLLVSEVCMGCMTFGEQNSEAEGHKLLGACSDAGVNFYDTAEMYPVAPTRETQGRTSEILGSWLATQDRSSVVVASKAVGRSAGQIWCGRHLMTSAQRAVGSDLDTSRREGCAPEAVR
jgi:aryl-alcohol dehydrogenase-like predicted oxidoreductase